MRASPRGGAAGRLGRAVPAVAAVALLLTACPREPAVDARPGGWVGEPGPDTVTGVVRQVGNVPFTRTVVQGEDEGVTVVGELRDEVTRLVGAEVRVTGERRPNGPFGPELQATAYEILSVDGDRPYVGVLEEDEEGYVLHAAPGGTLRIGAAPLRFRQLIGGRLWVTVDERATVQRYGILRAPDGVRETEEERERDPGDVRGLELDS